MNQFSQQFDVEAAGLIPLLNYYEKQFYFCERWCFFYYYFCIPICIRAMEPKINLVK